MKDGGASRPELRAGFIYIGHSAWVELLSESSPMQMQDKYVSTFPPWLLQRL